MHELSVARDICRAVADFAGGRRVKSFVVEVGALSGVAADALEFCIGEMAKEAGLGSPAITIEVIPASIECACGQAYTTDDLLEPCPSCGGYARKIVSGMDLSVRDIELEDESDD